MTFEIQPLTKKQIYKRAYYQKHRTEIREQMQESYVLNRVSRIASVQLYRHKNRDAVAASQRKWGARIRAEAIRALGGRCVRCGYDADIRALQIDHIRGDGAQMRRANDRRALYKSVTVSGSQGRYQILCANCNVIKRDENREYGNMVT